MSAQARPKVSVCLPVFNGERSLAAAIESVLSQSYENFELLLADDCSEDESGEIIADFAHQDKRIKHWTNPANVGLFASYNLCAKQASGSLIKFLTQHDLLDRRMLAECVGVLCEHNGVALVSTGRQIIDAAAADLSDETLIRTAGDLFGAGVEVRGPTVIRHCTFTLDNVVGEPSTVMLRRTSLAGGFDPRFRYLADLDCWLRSLLQGNYFFLTDRLCSVKRHAAGLSTDNSPALAFIADACKLGRRFLPVLAADDATAHDRFTETLLRQAASRVCDLRKSGSGEPPNRRDTVHSIVGRAADRLLDDPDAVKLTDELMDFRELTVKTLIRLQEANHPRHSSSNSPVIEREQKIANLEETLGCLLGSTSWKTTRLLRELRLWLSNLNVIRRHSVRITANKARQTAQRGQIAHTARTVEITSNIANRQTEYIKYLRWQIRRVTGSTSWRLTAFLRQADGSGSKIELPGREDLDERFFVNGLDPVRHWQKNYLSVAAMFRDEAPYLKEWLEFHLATGVEHFYLYDHLSSDQPMSVLAPYIATGVVEVISWPFEADGHKDHLNMIQCGAYMDAIKRASQRTFWLALIDVDEFLYPVQASTTPELLADYEDCAGLGVNWHAFGTSGLLGPPAGQLQIEAFTRCAPMDHPYHLHVKSVVQPVRVAACRNPHYVDYLPGHFQVNADKVPFLGAFAPYVASEKIRINHYWTRDEASLFRRKLPLAKKGGVDRNDALVQERLAVFNACQSDGAIAKFVPELRKRMLQPEFAYRKNSAAGGRNWYSVVGKHDGPS